MLKRWRRPPELPRSRPVLLAGSHQGDQPSIEVPWRLYDFWLSALPKSLFFKANLLSINNCFLVIHAASHECPCREWVSVRVG